MQKKNDIVRVTVEDLNNLGFGVAKIDGKAVFIADAVDGDVADVRLIRVNKSYAVGRLEHLLTPSPHRAAPSCSVKGCGGCAYRAVDYAHELARKENNVRFAFRKAGLGDAVIRPVLSVGETAHYRNKAQYAVAPDKEGKCVAGFYAPKSHRLCEATDCPLAAPEFSAIVTDVLAFCNENGVLPYDEATQTGFLRHIYLRRSAEGKVLLTAVVASADFPQKQAFIAAVTARHPEITGIYLNINPHDTNVICSDDYRHEWGQTHLEDTLCGVRLAISPASFYQVNRDAAELLYRRAALLADFRGDESILDLYSGVGSIGLSMAHAVREVIGVEIVADATKCAKKNAEANGIRNAIFLCADAGDAESLFAAVAREKGDGYRPDAVVLDPPRSGTTPELLAYLAERLSVPKILYISCNPDTLARDARILSDYGYKMSEVYPVDLFPRTGHVESLVCLQKQTN